MTIVELLAQIARRDPTRSEATLQADIRQLVLTAPLSLSAENVVTADLETPVGVRHRIDIEVGSCLIEVKRDLSAGNVLSDAIEQLADYLAARQGETGCRYVGILTDGADCRPTNSRRPGRPPSLFCSSWRACSPRPAASRRRHGRSDGGLGREARLTTSTASCCSNSSPGIATIPPSG